MKNSEMIRIKNLHKQYIQDYYKGESFSIFWISIILYSLGYLLNSSELFSSRILATTMMALGIVGITYSFFKLVNVNISNKYLKIVYFFYIMWQLFIVIPDLHDFNYIMIRDLLSDPYIFLHYLIPLVILIPVNIFFVKRMFNYFEYLGILLLIVFFLFKNQILEENQNFSELTVWTLGTGCGFLILTWVYHNNKRKVIALLAVLLSLFISTIMARRNIMLTFTNYIVFSVLIVLFSSSQSLMRKIYVLLIVLLTTSTAYYFFEKHQDTIFSKITDRINKDTRDVLFTTFFNEMSQTDLIYGKGLNGSYFCPGIEENDYRIVIENGYLQTILKGGIIYLAFFLFIAFPALFLGLFKSNNLLSKAAGSIVLLWLIDMAAFGLSAFNIRYFLLWMCVGLCYNEELRNLSDCQIQNSLFLKN